MNYLRLLLPVLLFLAPFFVFAQPVHIIDSDWSGRCDGVADYDLDGDLDLYAATTYDGILAGWENNGWQNFSRHEIELPNFDPYQTRLADLDGDHDTDLISIEYGGTPSRLIWLENEAGNFTLHELTALPQPYNHDFRGLAVCDFDQDGDTDILTTQLYYSSPPMSAIVLHENDGSQNFTPTILHETNSGGVDIYVRLFVNDLDNDGDLDIGVQNAIGHQLLLNHAPDGYELLSLESGFASDQAWGDYDDDGDLDFTMIGASSYTYMECVSLDPLTYDPHPLALNPDDFLNYGTVRAADHDLDGDLDLYIWFKHPGEWLLTGIFDGVNSFTLDPLPFVGEGLYPADIDNDGDMDQLTTRYDQGLVWIENELVTPAQIRVRLIPEQTPVLLPPTGGPLPMLVSVNNTTGSMQTIRAWLVYTRPDGNEVVVGLRLLTVTAGSIEHYPISPTIPAGQAVGQYRASVRIGTYPIAVDEYSYPFWIE